MPVPLGEFFPVAPSIGLIVLEIDILQGEFDTDFVIGIHVQELGLGRFAPLAFALHLPEQFFKPTGETGHVAQRAGFELLTKLSLTAIRLWRSWAKAMARRT